MPCGWHPLQPYLGVLSCSYYSFIEAVSPFAHGLMKLNALTGVCMTFTQTGYSGQVMLTCMHVAHPWDLKPLSLHVPVPMAKPPMQPVTTKKG